MQVTTSPINVSQVPQRSIFRYPGGKTWFVPYIRSWLAGRKVSRFIEPFAGGGIVGLTVAFEELAKRVLLVERDEHVAAVWKVILNGKGINLAQRIVDFDFSASTVRVILSENPRNLFDRAFATVIRNRVQHGGILAPGASLMKDGENHRGLGSRWYPETLSRRIRNIVSVKGRIDFIQGDAFEVIEKYRQLKNVAFFVDPPYTEAGRRLYSYSDIDHEKLFRLLAQAKCDFLMTYDNVVQIRKLAKKYKLSFITIPMMGRLNQEKHELVISRSRSQLQAMASLASP